MATAGVRVTGLNKVVRDLKSLGLEVDDLKDAFSTIAQLAAESAARYAPRRTGKLAGNIRGNRAQSKAVVRAGGASVPYAGAINYGYRARNIAPALFMQKADAQMKPISVALLENQISSAIRKRGLGK